MPWRGLRFGTVGPEFGEDAGVVATGDHLHRVGTAGHRIQVVALTGIAAFVEVVERFEIGGVAGKIRVADRVRTDVDLHVVRGVEVRRPDEHLLESLEVFQFPVRPDQRGRSRIEVEIPIASIPLIGGALVRPKTERRHAAPFRTEERRHATFDHVAGLIDELLESDRLPAIRLLHHVAGLFGEDRQVHRSIPLVGVVVSLVRVVLFAEQDVGLPDPIADRGGVVTDRVREVRVEAELDHQGVVLRAEFLETRRRCEAMPENPECRV